MKQLLKQWMQIGLCCLLPMAAMAQEKQRATPETRAQRSVETIGQKVTMTPDEQQAMQKAFTTYFQRVQEQRENKNMKGIKELGEKRDAEVKAILKDDGKYAAYLSILEERKLRMKSAGAQRRAGTAEE